MEATIAFWEQNISHCELCVNLLHLVVSMPMKLMVTVLSLM